MNGASFHHIMYKLLWQWTSLNYCIRWAHYVVVEEKWRSSGEAVVETSEYKAILRDAVTISIPFRDRVISSRRAVIAVADQRAIQENRLALEGDQIKLSLCSIERRIRFFMQTFRRVGGQSSVSSSQFAKWKPMKEVAAVIHLYLLEDQTACIFA